LRRAKRRLAGAGVITPFQILVRVDSPRNMSG
jgi:hypothetical protein